MESDAERDGERAPKYPRKKPTTCPVCRRVLRKAQPRQAPAFIGETQVHHGDPSLTNVARAFTRLGSTFPPLHLARCIPYTLYRAFGETLPSLVDVLDWNSCLLTHAERFPRGRVPYGFLFFRHEKDALKRDSTKALLPRLGVVQTTPTLTGTAVFVYT